MSQIYPNSLGHDKINLDLPNLVESKFLDILAEIAIGAILDIGLVPETLSVIHVLSKVCIA